MLLTDNPINIEFYFTFDGLIVIHNVDYKIVQDVYNKYYLYTVGKYKLKAL